MRALLCRLRLVAPRPRVAGQPSAPRSCVAPSPLCVRGYARLIRRPWLLPTHKIDNSIQSIFFINLMTDMPSIDYLRSILVSGVSQKIMDNCIYSYITRATQHDIEELFVLLFQLYDQRKTTLACRLTDMLAQEESTYPIVLDLLDLVPHYGQWSDLLKLGNRTLSKVKYLVCSQFLKDEHNLLMRAGGDSSKPISSLALAMPSVGHRNAINYIITLVPGPMYYSTRCKLYRNRRNALRRALIIPGAPSAEQMLPDSSRYDLLRQRIRCLFN